MAKVSVIGAGNVGATAANVMATMQFASEIILLDIKEGVAEGKAMDMMQTANLNGFVTKIRGVTSDYSATANSDVVVITSGIPRKPGMTREELIGTNATIVTHVAESALKHSPDAILVIVSNPMDTLAYLTYRKTGLPKERVIGMGGILDSSRFTYFLSEALDVHQADVDGMVIGGHGDTTMIPLTRLATYRGVPISTLMEEEQLEEVAAATMVGGATLTRLLRTSAWYAPGAATARLVRSIILDEKRLYPCSVLLEGEYGRKELNIGVPVIIGANGVEEIVEIELTDKELELFNKSADAVAETNKVLYSQGLL